MAAELFNSLTGYSVGIPAVPVVDNTGNVVSNFLNLAGNVSANKVYANTYYYANGQPLSVTAAGSNNQVQYNFNNVFSASPNFTFDSTANLLEVTNLTVPGNTTLGDLSNVHIFGGNIGYVVSTDGTGNLSWIKAGQEPGGATTQLQFNDNGVFNGSTALTFNKNNNLLTLGGNLVLGNTAVYWAQATTTSITNQAIASIPITGTSIVGIEFFVRGVDQVGSKYNIATLQAVTNGSTVDYTTYGTVRLTGSAGTLSADIYTSGLTTSVRLLVTPTSSNSTNWITQIRTI